MERLEVSGAVRPLYESLGVKRLIYVKHNYLMCTRLHVSFVTGLLDFTYFINVNILGSQRVHRMCCLDPLEGLMMTV